MSEINNIEIVNELVDIIKSKCINIIQAKDVLHECIRFINNTNMHYFKEKSYNVEDICNAPNQNMSMLIRLMDNNNIFYLRDPKGNLYIDSAALNKILSPWSTCKQNNNQLQKTPLEPTRVSAETPRVTMER